MIANRKLYQVLCSDLKVQKHNPKTQPTFLQVHHSLRIVLQRVVYPPQAPVGQGFSNQVVGLRRYTQVLLLEDHGPLKVPQRFVGEAQVAVGPTLAAHAACLLGYIQSPLVPLADREEKRHR